MPFWNNFYPGGSVWSHFDWFSDIRHYNTTSCGLRSFVGTFYSQDESWPRAGPAGDIRFLCTIKFLHSIRFSLFLSFGYKNVRNIPVLVVVLGRCLYTGTGQTLRHQEEEEEEEEEKDIKNNSIKISRYYLQAAVDHWVAGEAIVVNKQTIRRSSVLLMSVYTTFL